MINKTIVAFFLIFLTFAFGKLTIMYIEVYQAHQKAEEQLNKIQQEQERINKLTVEEILKEIPPKYGVKVSVAESVTKCESQQNPLAINYNDGGVGKHSYGMWQYQVSTWEDWSKKYGEELDIHSPYDQTKLASYMLSKNQGRQWTCYRNLYNV